MASSRGILIPGTYEPLPFADANGQDDRRTSRGVRWRAWAAVLAASAVAMLVVAAAVFGASRMDPDAVASSVQATADHGVSENTSAEAEAPGGLSDHKSISTYMHGLNFCQAQNRAKAAPAGSQRVYASIGWIHQVMKRKTPSITNFVKPIAANSNSTVENANATMEVNVTEQPMP